MAIGSGERERFLTGGLRVRILGRDRDLQEKKINPVIKSLSCFSFPSPTHLDRLELYELDLLLRSTRILLSGLRLDGDPWPLLSGEPLRRFISIDLDRRESPGDRRRSSLRICSFSRIIRLNASSGSSIIPVPTLAATP